MRCKGGFAMVMTVEIERVDALPEHLEDVGDPVESDDVGERETDERDDLGRWLEATLKDKLGLDAIHRDADGDIPVSLGGPTVYVRQGEPGSEFVTVLALLLEDFGVTQFLFQAVNVINVETPMAKTVVDLDDRQIVMSVKLPVIDSLSPEDLMLAIETVSDWAEYWDTLLQASFGGATTRDC